MAPPPNTTIGTATVIPSLPATVIQDCRDGTTNYTLWYQYTAIDPDVELSVFGYGDATHYQPGGCVFLAGSVFYAGASAGTATQNKTIQCPVTPGVTYYLRFAPNTQTAGATTLTLSVESFAQTIAPAGSLLINDDTDPTNGAPPGVGFPVVALSATTGTPLRFHTPFAAGETADVLPIGSSAPGVMLFHDKATHHLKLYAPADLSVLADLDYGSDTSNSFPIRSNHTSGFYVNEPGNAGSPVGTVTTVTGAGAFGPTTWGPSAVLRSVHAIAPSPDETVLYFVKFPGAPANVPVRRWDLVNNVQLTDLVATLGTTWKSDWGCLLVLTDGTLLVGYNSTTQATAPIVKHYATDGSTLNTYTLTGSLSVDLRLASALDDPTSFWVWTKLAPHPSVSRFTHVKVSDGSTLATFDARQYEVGIYQGAATATPDARFGHSESCPFLVTRAAIGIPPITGTVDLTVPTTTRGRSTISTYPSVSGLVTPPRPAGDCWRRR